MKKIVLIALALLVASGSLEAHGRDGRGPDAYDWRYGGWISPFFLGGIIGYTIAPRQTVIYETAPVRTTVIQSPTQVVVQPASSSDVYEERWVYFDDCKCERKVLVKISQ